MKVKSLCSDILYYIMVACSRLQDMQKRVGMVRGREDPPLTQITRVIFAWVVFCTHTLWEPGPILNLMVTVKLTIIYYYENRICYQEITSVLDSEEWKLKAWKKKLTVEIIWILREMRQKKKKKEKEWKKKKTGKKKTTNKPKKSDSVTVKYTL